MRRKNDLTESNSRRKKNERARSVSPAKTVIPKFKVWVSSCTGLVIFGEGRYRLLLAIEKFGSLSQAAIELGISYRKAWGDLKSTEERLGCEITEKCRGGSGGGHSGLTKEGKKLISSYKAFKRDVKKAVDDSCRKHFGKI